MSSWPVFIYPSHRLYTSCAGCHFSSLDLVRWTEHPPALVSNSPFDASCIDTGAVFQHPNGSVFAVYATINATSNSASGSVDGDICLARALDPMLIKWVKLCDQEPYGKISSPICDWCRNDCPLDCKQNENSTAPSPWPGILGRGGHRDPPAPWLVDCLPPGTEPSGTEQEQCWYQPVASGGRIPANTLDPNTAVPAITVFKNNLALSGQWEAVQYDNKSTDPPIVWWNSREEGGPPEFSCPDMVALPGTDAVLFYSLNGRYFIGGFKNVSAGGPLFETVSPFNHSFGLPIAAAGGSKKPERNWG